VTCQARQHSDQMLCGRCGLAWDVSDPSPPQCSPRPAPVPLGRPKRVPAAFRKTTARFIDANRDVLGRE